MPDKDKNKKPALPAWVEQSIADLPIFLTIPEAAQALRGSERQMYRLAAEGRIVMISKGGKGSRKLIPRASIGEYLASREVAS
jgi:hypothetical protein